MWKKSSTFAAEIHKPHRSSAEEHLFGRSLKGNRVQIPSSPAAVSLLLGVHLRRWHIVTDRSQFYWEDAAAQTSQKTCPCVCQTAFSRKGRRQAMRKIRLGCIALVAVCVLCSAIRRLTLGQAAFFRIYPQCSKPRQTNHPLCNTKIALVRSPKNCHAWQSIQNNR